MKRITFTQARIKSLPIPTSGRTDYYDNDVPKLCCRVSSSGSKKYTVITRFENKVVRLTLGSTGDLTVKDARDLAREKLGLMAKGINPIAQKMKSIVLSEVLKDYIKNRHPKNGKVLKQNTIDGYIYTLNTSFSDWLSMPVSKITRKMVSKRYTQLTATGTATANAAARVLRLTLKHARKIGAVESVATDVLVDDNAWHSNTRRKRIIKMDDLPLWYEVVKTLNNERAKVYLLMLLYTGLRSSEALFLKWSDVDLKRKTLIAKETKNHLDHNLPIPSSLLPYLKGLHNLTGDKEYLFNAPGSDKPITTPRKPMAKVTRITDIEFSSHDLRRTFATIAESLSIPLTTIKQLLNHSPGDDVTTGYIQTEEATLRLAIDKVGSFIHSKATQKDNVIKLHG